MEEEEQVNDPILAQLNSAPQKEEDDPILAQLNQESGGGASMGFTEGSQEPQEQPSQPSEESGTPSPLVEQPYTPFVTKYAKQAAEEESSINDTQKEIKDLSKKMLGFEEGTTSEKREAAAERRAVLQEEYDKKVDKQLTSVKTNKDEFKNAFNSVDEQFKTTKDELIETGQLVEMEDGTVKALTDEAAESYNAVVKARAEAAEDYNKDLSILASREAALLAEKGSFGGYLQNQVVNKFGDYMRGLTEVMGKYLIQPALEAAGAPEATGQEIRDASKRVTDPFKEGLGTKETTPQYAERIQEEDDVSSGIVGGIASIPTMITPAMTGIFFESYANAGDEVEGLNLTEGEKETYQILSGGIEWGFERAGTARVLAKNPVLKRAIIGRILPKLKKGIAGEQLNRLVASEIKKIEASGVENFMQAVVAEGGTGMGQEAGTIGLKEAFNEYKAEEIFDEGTIEEYVTQIVKAGKQEAIGAILLSGGVNVANSFSSGDMKAVTQQDLEAAQMLATDPTKAAELIREHLKGKPDAYVERVVQSSMELAEVLQKIPPQQQLNKKAISLVKEKTALQDFVEGKEDGLVAPEKARIKAIEEELAAIVTPKQNEEALEPVEEAAVTPTETTTEGATDKVNKLFDSRVKIATEKFDKAINDVIKESGLPYYEANELKRVTELRAEKDKTISDLESKRSKALKTKLKGAVKKTSVQNDKDVDSLDDLGISDEELLELEDEIGFEEKTSQAPEVLEQGMVSDGGKNYEITSIDNKKDGSKVVKAKEVIEVTEDNIEDLQSKRKAPLKVGDKVYGTTKRYIGDVAEQIAKDNAVGVFEEKAPKPPKWKTKGTSKKQEVTTPTKTTSSKAKPTIEERTEEDIEKELEEGIKSIEKDQKDFEQAILDELAAKNRNRDLVSLKGNIYQVTRKPDGTFSVSKMREDGKLIGIKSDTTERKAAIAQFKRKQTQAEKSDMTQAEKLVEDTKKESEDRILKALDKAIQDTSFTRLRGQANDVVTVLGVTAANLSLRGVRAAYKAGVSLKEAIAIQYAKIKGTGITELEFKRFVLESLKPTPQKTQQQDKDKKETEEAPIEGKKEVTNAEKTKIAEEIGKARKVKPKNIKGLLDVMGGIFGLNKKQAESASVVGDVIIGNMAKRAGISKDEMYQKIAYQKAQKAPDGSLKQMISEDADGNVIFESSVKRGLSELPNNPMTPDAWVAQISKKGGRGTQEELYVIGVLDKNSDGNYVVSQNFKDAIGWIGDKKVDLKDQKAIDGKYWKSVPKEVVEKYINDNQIEIIEIVKGESITWEQTDNKWKYKDYEIRFENGEDYAIYYDGKNFGSYASLDIAKQAMEDYINDRTSSLGDTKYSQYTLEGGKNYREVLLTLPRKDKITAKLNEDSPYYKWDLFDSSGIKIGSSSKNRESDAIKDVRNPNNYKSSHWDEANILAHLRLNERTLPNGERVMFIEEVQSDWAQEGKKKGFETKEVEEKRKQREEIRLELVEIDKKIEELEARKKSFESLSDTFSSQKELLQEKGRLEKQLETVRNNRDFERIEEGIRNLNKALNYKSDNIQRIDEEIYDLKYGNPKREQLRDRLYEMDNANDGSEAPDMPYKKTDQWVGMAMRRAMQMAAQEGFDRVAWVTGEQSADRYDLSKQVDRVEVADMLDGNRSVYISMKDNSDTQLFVDPKTGKILQSTDKGIDGKMLEDVVGKEISNKILNLNTEKESVISSEGLKIGGEGMKAFYNSILPKVAQKEAQRFDKSAKVKVVDFGDNTRKVIVDVQRDGSIRLINEGGGFIAEYNKNQFDEAYKEADRLNERIDNSQVVGKQLSIPITPEMRMNLNGAVPLFQGEQGAMAAADGNYVVYALTDPNISTPLHELAHVYEHYLTDKERADIESWSGHNAGTVEFSEAFARGFEKFLAGGKVNNPKLQKIFENFKEWLTEIYNGITGSEIDIELNDKMKSIYNEMLGATPEKVKSTQTVAQETKGLSEKEKTKQGFIEYTEAIKEKSREKLDAATDKIKKRLDTQVQKLKDFKERKRVITSFANSLLTDLKKSGVKYVPTAKVKTILNLVNSAKTDDSLKTATDKLIQTIRDIAVTDKEVKLKAQRIDNVNQAKKNAKMGKFGNFESAYAILNLKEIPQQFEKEYYDVMSNLGQRGAFEIDVDAVNELYEKISKLPITEDITKEETIGDTTEGKKEITEVKSGTHTSSNPIKIFKGLGGKVDLNGVRINAHEGAEGVFTAVDEDLAKEYAKDKGMSEIILPAGTTFEVVEVDGTGMTPGQYRAAEVKAINDSKADVVKLITVDGRIKAGTKKQEQYVVKNLKLIESKLDITETVAAIDEAKQDLTDENIKELPSDYISDIRQFIKVPTEFLNRYNKQFLKNLEAAVKNAKNGIMTGNAITSVVRDYEASLDAKDIVDNNILEKTAEQAKKVFKGASKIFTKNYYKNRKSKNVPQLVGELSNKYTAYFDSVLGSLKGTPIYEAFNNITSKKSTAESQTNNTKAEFTKKLKSAIRSRIPFIKRMSQVSGEPFFRLSVRSQLYLQQKQFESNRKSKGVQSVDDIIKNIKENLVEYEAATNLTPKEIEIIIDEYNKGAVDGNLSAEKMWADMNSKERDLIKFMRAELDKSGKKSEYINIAFRNNPLPQYKDYFPRSGSTVVTEEFDFFQSLKDGKIGRQSFKTRSSNERARTIDFISFSPFNDFMNHITSVNYDYYLTPEVSRFTSMTGQIGDIANQQETKRVAESMNQIMKATLNTSFNETNKATNSTFSDVLGRSVLGGITRNLLIKPTRLISEFVFNYLPVVTLKSKSLLKTLPERKAFNKVDALKKIQERFGSVQQSRVGAYKLDMKDLGQGLDKRFNSISSEVKDAAERFIRSNYLTDFSKGASQLFYEITDSAAKPIWEATFLEEFKKESGSEFDAAEFVKDNNEYSDKYKRSIEKAKARADKRTSAIFNTAERMESKLNQQKRTGLKSLFYDFMQSFAYNEAPAIKEAVHSTLGHGAYGRMEGVTTLLALSTRAVGYQVLNAYLFDLASNLVINLISEGKFSFDDEDDEYDLKITDELNKGLASFALLMAIGNKAAWVKGLVAIGTNAAYQYGYYPFFTERGKEGKEFDIYQDSPLFSPNISKQGATGFAGGLGILNNESQKLAKSTDKLLSKAMPRLAEGDLTLNEAIDIMNESKMSYYAWKNFNKVTGIPMGGMEYSILKGLENKDNVKPAF